MDYYNRVLGADIPTFTDFDKMMQTVQPDEVIVCTKDSQHHDFIIRSFEYGCNVISEKPMTIDEVKCRQILEAEKKTGKKVTVTFNYRFVPYVTKIRELLSQNIIGKILSVDYSYDLDRSHGADYFRRWHRRKENSGGLLVHKSTHHFDLVNWFLGQEPVEVFALGSLQFYGPTRKERGINCRSCDYKNTCEFYFDINTPTRVGNLINNSELYAKVEHLDGYIRDQCVFSEEIDIEDTVSLTVRYSGGTLMSYALNAHGIYEGWQMVLNGTEGRMQLAEWSQGPVGCREKADILIKRWKKPLETITVPLSDEAHGGADTLLQKMLFGGAQADPLGHMASSRSGAMALMIGAAANRSIASGKAIQINELLKC